MKCKAAASRIATQQFRTPHSPSVEMPRFSTTLIKCALIAAGVAQCRASFSYGTVMAQDPLPACTVQIQCNGVFCADTCVDNTVSIDLWLYNTIRFQYDLTVNRSWKFGPIIGTHNAFISRANGFGLTEDLAAALYSRTNVGSAPNGGGSAGSMASTHVRVSNQRYGPWTLLDLGVRELEFDIWDISWDGLKTFDVYMCHSPVPDPDAVVYLQEAADALGLGDLQYDPFTELCSNHTLAWAMNATKAWLQQPQNDEQLVAMFLDNRVATWNINIVANVINSTWSDWLMTPSDLQTIWNGSWPSRAQMLAAGKRGYCESNSYVGNNYTGTVLAEVCFFPTTWSDMQLDDATLQPFPNCSISNGNASDSSWYGAQFTRVLDSGDLAWSPAEEAETSVIYKPNGIADLVNCGYNNIGASDLSPANAVGFVWSWAPGEPAPLPPNSTAPASATASSQSSGLESAATMVAAPACRAAAMTLVRGSWTAQPCDSQFVALCRLGDNTIPAGNNPNAWNFTSSAVPFTGAAAACSSQFGAGWAFDVPRDGRENQLVANKALFAGLFGRATPGIWLNVAV